MKKNIIITIVALSFFTQVQAQPEIKGAPEELRNFLHPHEKITSLFATADKKAYTDQAIITLTVKTEDSTLSKSLDNNAALREKLNGALVAKGLKREAIKNSQFSSSPQYGWFGKKPGSYVVENRVKVEVTSEAHFQIVTALADKYKEVTVTGTAFEHTKKDIFEQEVKQLALDKVLKQKRFYEKNLGLTLKAVNFRESFFKPMPMVKQRRTKAKLQSLATESYQADQQPSAEVSFDEIQYQATITVDYVIERQ